ncbi:hypothetical protein CPCC7001_1425 [Cyanobium sp. PCC 7001]|nr:hypothetical protein CPCC7001_1425 [Cyanobium sp. PCC 7001]
MEQGRPAAEQTDPPPPGAEANQAGVARLMSALQALSIPPSDLGAIETDLQGDLASIPMQRLGLDSLGSMELCIHLELDHGVVITPADLLGMQTVQELIARLRPQDP